MSNLTILSKKQEETTRWPIDRCLDELNEFEEIVVIAKSKDGRRYKRFSSRLNDTFWWLGAIEALKRELMDESFRVVDL